MDLESEDYDNRTLTTENGTEMVTTSYDPDWGGDGHKNRLDTVQIILIGLYSTISVLGFVGNTLILLALMKNYKQRTIINFFIGNLAFSDILVVLFCSPFTLSSLLLEQWVLGELMCRIMPFLQCSSVLVSTLILISIAIIRYQRIKYPLSKSLTFRQSTYLLGLSWAVGFLICSPLPIFYRLLDVSEKIGKNGTYATNSTEPRYICSEAWPDESYRIAFSLCLLVVQYIIPLICLIVSHTSVCRTITCKMSTREMKRRLEEREKREQKEKKEKEKKEKQERKEREKREKERKGKKDMVETIEMKDMKEAKEMMGPSDIEDDLDDDLDLEDLEGTMDMKDIMELRELKRELRERRERRERMGRRGRRKMREMLEVRELEKMDDVEEVMDLTEMIEMKEMHAPRNVRDVRDAQNAEEIEGMIEMREGRDESEMRATDDIEDMSGSMEMRGMGDPRDEMMDTKEQRGRSWKRGRRGQKGVRELNVEEVEEIEELGSMYGMYEMEEMEQMSELGGLSDPNTGDEDLDEMEDYAAKNSGHHIKLPKFQRWSYALSRKHRKMYNKKSCVVPVLRHPPPPPAEAPPKEIEEEEEEGAAAAAEPERSKLTNASKIIPGVPICFVVKPEEKELEEPEMLTISRSISRIRKRSRRVVYRLTILILVFAISWMPLHVFHVVTDFNAGLLSNRNYRLLYCFCHLLGMLSCCLNPILYGFLNNGIKADLMALLRCG